MSAAAASGEGRPPPGRLVVLGFGYTAGRLARLLLPRDWSVAGTARTPDRAEALRAAGIEPLAFPLADAPGVLAGATHVLASMPPAPGGDSAGGSAGDSAGDSGGDPALAAHGETLARLRAAGWPAWIGYLSSTAVYGDTGGAWVDEEAPTLPALDRGARRVAAEAAWRALGAHVFRLPGIYGPGRSAFDQLRAGTARRIHKPGQVFCRVHVDDIAAALVASMARPAPGRVYNVADDAPAPNADVVAFAASLLGMPPPPLEPFDPATLSPMARSFWTGCRRVANRRMKTELGVVLRHPDHASGLRAILEEEAGAR